MNDRTLNLLNKIEINVNLKDCGIYPFETDCTTKVHGKSKRWQKIESICDSLGEEEARKRLVAAFNEIKRLRKLYPGSYFYHTGRTYNIILRYLEGSL
ncbi:MAG: hypothetical protein Tsb0014_09850 [Pleurocapsa sp.]